MLSEILASVLVCPRCQGPLSSENQPREQLRCGPCNVVFAVDRGVPRMTDGAVERDARIAAEYEAQDHAHTIYMDPTYIMNDWEREVLPRLTDWLGDVSGPVLDVGCGVGKLGASLVARGRNVELIGTDFQGKLLDEVTTGYAALVEADVHRLPFKSESFSAAITSNALHHFPDPLVAMAQIARVLKPGGVLVAYDPRFVTPLEMLKKALRQNDAAFTKDHKAFRVGEYRELLGSSGLTVTDVQTVDPLGPLLATGLDYLKLGKLGVAPTVAKALAAVDRMIGTTPVGLMLAARAVKPAATSRS